MTLIPFRETKQPPTFKRHEGPYYGYRMRDSLRDSQRAVDRTARNLWLVVIGCVICAVALGFLVAL